MTQRSVSTPTASTPTAGARPRRAPESTLWNAAEIAARAGLAMPSVLAAAARRRRLSLAAFDAAVPAVLADSITDPDRRERMRTVLRASGVKAGHVIASYGAMAGIPVSAEVSVLGGCFARIYDDLLTGCQHTGLVDRLTALFLGGDVVPACDLERTLLALYGAIETRLERQRPDRPDGPDRTHRALGRLHRRRTRLYDQREAWLSDTELFRVTITKGGLSLAMLFCLTWGRMSPAGNALALELGGALQLIDDYQDREIDRRRGTHTLATRGRLRLAGIVRLLRQLEGVLGHHYGPRPVGRFIDELYVYLLLSIAGRHRARRGRRGRRIEATRQVSMARGGLAGRLALPGAPLRVILPRGGDAVHN